MASNTKRLRLLKKDPATDGNDTFNIKTMLNENWDKIDERVALLDPETGKLPADQLEIDTSGLATKQELDAHKADDTKHLTNGLLKVKNELNQVNYLLKMDNQGLYLEEV